MRPIKGSMLYTLRQAARMPGTTRATGRSTIGASSQGAHRMHTFLMSANPDGIPAVIVLEGRVDPLC